MPKEAHLTKWAFISYFTRRHSYTSPETLTSSQLHTLVLYSPWCFTFYTFIFYTHTIHRSMCVKVHTVILYVVDPSMYSLCYLQERNMQSSARHACTFNCNCALTNFSYQTAFLGHSWTLKLKLMKVHWEVMRPRKDQWNHQQQNAQRTSMCLLHEQTLS